MIRGATADDVGAICAFGSEHVRAHYEPLIGPDGADQQVSRWWSHEYVAAAVAGEQVVVAEAGRELVGVAQSGRSGADHVVYKLYLHPTARGRHIGRLLLDALVGRLPPDVTRLHVEHFAANERAGAFYAREGFGIDRIEPGPDRRTDVVWRSADVPLPAPGSA
ncbi:MAG: GNAT family N-acetyltransferase [Brevundimonas sp.]